MTDIPPVEHVLAIIPARGGSRGVPRKNVRPLAGRPLLAYTIDHALAARRVTRVVVSTDDAEIGTIAARSGAEVIWRPAAISGNTATTESALLHVLDTLQATEGYTPDLVVLLQCTSPLRLPGDIDRAIETLIHSGADSLLSLVPFGRFLWRLGEDGRLQSYNYDYRRRPRRQEYAAGLYMENGSIYIMRPRLLREENNRLGGRIAHYLMHPLTAVEIDQPEDFALAEAIMAGPWPPVE